MQKLPKTAHLDNETTGAHIRIYTGPKGTPKEISRASLNSTQFGILWAADYRSKAFVDQEGYLRKPVLRVTWPSVGNTTVYVLTICELHLRTVLAQVCRVFAHACIVMLIETTGSRRSHRFAKTDHNHDRQLNPWSTIQLEEASCPSIHCYWKRLLFYVQPHIALEIRHELEALHELS
jgi:hypothetical protein